MKISRRNFILGGTASIAAAGIMPTLSSCSQKTKSGIDPAKFETDGVSKLHTGLESCSTSNVPTRLYTLTNAKGAELCLTNFGARIVSFMVPDISGQYRDMVLGFDNIKDYANYNEAPNNYFGAICGRYANRISKGQFNLDGKSYQLDLNDNGNTVHGGKFGYNNQTFEVYNYEINKSVTFILINDDRDMGFPGILTLKVTYTLNDNNTLGIFYDAETTDDTPINFTNHSYWDPCGDANSPITDDTLIIYSKAFTPINDQLIPTGEIMPIESGSTFDFFGKNGGGKMLELDFNIEEQQLKYANGYNHNFVIMSQEELKDAGIDFDGNFQITDDGSYTLQGKANLVAKVKSSLTGITMTITSTEPGLQFYDCHDFDATITGKNKSKFTKHAAFVLDPQHFPDSPNHPNFPNTILKQGQVYKSKTEYSFTL